VWHKVNYSNSENQLERVPDCNKDGKLGDCGELRRVRVRSGCIFQSPRVQQYKRNALEAPEDSIGPTLSHAMKGARSEYESGPFWPTSQS
jgi:hypothetical protein